MRLPEREKLQGLQALRGIAVLCVFIFHMFSFANVVSPKDIADLQGLGFAGIGVFVFFGLSGFIITHKSDDPPVKFIIDRIRRIYPGFWISIIAGALSIWYIANIWPSVDIRTILLIANGHQTTVPLPYWSLFFEIHFYAVIILLAVVIRRFMMPALLLWGLGSALLYQRPIVFATAAYPATYDLVIFSIYNLYFVGGAFAAWQLRPSIERAWWSAAAAALLLEGPSLIGELGLGWIWGPLGKYDVGYLLGVPGVFFAVRSALLWRADDMIGRALSRIGDLSYGIYLMHMPIALSLTVLIQRLGLKPTYWVAFLLISSISLGTSSGFGWIDVKTQAALKTLKWRLASRSVTQNLDR